MVSLLAFAQEQEEKNLGQDEFYDLIVNQTMIGEWAGTAYTQIFYEDGRTSYQEGTKGENNTLSWGTWRITQDGKYCSVWPPSPRESCYKVTLKGKQFIWYSGNNRYPSELLAKDTTE